MGSFYSLVHQRQMIAYLQETCGFLKPLAPVIGLMEITAVVVVLPIVWFFADRWKAWRVLHWFLLSQLANIFLKAYFLIPRPCEIDSSIKWLPSVEGSSFPSGAAQSSVIYVAAAFYLSSSRLIRICGLSLGLLISFSRVLVGFHYPTDILGGWFIGLCIIYIESMTTHTRLYGAAVKSIHHKTSAFAYKSIPIEYFWMVWVLLGILITLMIPNPKQIWVMNYVISLCAILGLLFSYEIRKISKAWMVAFLLCLWFSYLQQGHLGILRGLKTMLMALVLMGCNCFAHRRPFSFYTDRT